MSAFLYLSFWYHTSSRPSWTTHTLTGSLIDIRSLIDTRLGSGSETPVQPHSSVFTPFFNPSMFKKNEQTLPQACMLTSRRLSGVP